MTPELALAIDDVSVVTATLLVKLYQNVKKAFLFKAQCQSLCEDAQAIQRQLDQNQTTVDKLESAKELRNVVQDIVDFAGQCGSRNFLSITIEVFVKKRYPALKGRLMSLKKKIIFESQMVTASRVEAINSALRPSDDGQSIWHTLASLKELVEQDRNKDPLKGGAASRVLNPDFTMNSQFKITIDPSTGDGKGEAENIGPIVLKQIPQSGNTLLYLNTYREIQAGAYVQKFFGTILVDNTLYAIMEDLSEGITLGKAIENGFLAAMPPADRLRIACDIAKAMAWFHAAEMLLKSLTEDSVILHKGEAGTIYPVLVDLQASRKFMERTTGKEQDVRYDAPEYRAIKQHTRSTDIWSLGTVVWQLLAVKHPFDIPEAIFDGDKEATIIHSSLDKEAVPGNLDEFQSVFHSTVFTAVQDCWQRDAMLRRPASSIAQTLLAALSTASATKKVEKEPELESQAVDIAEVRARSQAIHAKMLENIRKSRQFNERKTRVPEPEADLKLNNDDFRFLLLEQTDWSPVKFFVIGAAIWWKLAEYESSEDTDNRLGTAERQGDETRARNALEYLEAAAASGYAEADFELHKIHWQLARSARLRYEENCSNP